MEYSLSQVIQDDLKTFQEITKYKSFSKASIVLGVEQGTLSKIISKLEIRLKEKLFLRLSHGLALTQAGEKLLKSLETINQALKTDLNKKEIKRLTFGCHEVIAQTYLPIFLPKFIDHFPDTNLEIINASSLNITEKVHSGEIDLGLVVNPVKKANLIRFKISKEYSTIWSQTVNANQILLVHPDMILIGSIKQKAQFNKIQLIPSYQLIAELLVKNPTWAGILPHPIALKYQLKTIGTKMIDVEVQLIARTNRFEHGFLTSLKQLF
jgi:hypothetical protein